MAIEHCASAYEDGFDAWQFGYDDVMYDGIDMASELPCICLECLNKYHEGQEAAIKEIFAGKQSAQQSFAPDSATAGDSCPPEIVKSENTLPA
jgi:hypothetical protein